MLAVEEEPPVPLLPPPPLMVMLLLVVAPAVFVFPFTAAAADSCASLTCRIPPFVLPFPAIIVAIRTYAGTGWGGGGEDEGGEGRVGWEVVLDLAS